MHLPNWAPWVQNQPNNFSAENFPDEHATDERSKFLSGYSADYGGGFSDVLPSRIVDEDGKEVTVEECKTVVYFFSKNNRIN